MRSAGQTKTELLSVAVKMFAAEGFQKTSIRAIAKQAGVSPALLIHHFGTKDAIIKEAISITLGSWVADEKAAMLEDKENQLASWQEIVKQGAVPLNFFKQVLLAGGHYSSRLFDSAVAESEQLLDRLEVQGKLKKVTDKRATSVLLALSGLSSVLMMEDIERSLGGSIASEKVALALMTANNEMMRNGLFKESEPATENGEK